MRDTASEWVMSVNDGLTDDGAVMFRVTFVGEPIWVAPEKVVVVIVTAPVVEFGIWFSSDSGGVQVVDAPTPVAMVPEAEPMEYAMVWVKPLSARFVLIVTEEPAGVGLAENEGVDARGIVESVRLPPVDAEPHTVEYADAETLMILPPLES
jgi:hypothetical protein